MTPQLLTAELPSELLCNCFNIASSTVKTQKLPNLIHDPSANIISVQASKYDFRLFPILFLSLYVVRAIERQRWLAKRTRFFLSKEEDIAVIRNNILATNQNKAPTHSVGHYEVLELLGSGAFGSVYKVCKKDYVVLVSGNELKGVREKVHCRWL